MFLRDWDLMCPANGTSDYNSPWSDCVAGDSQLSISSLSWESIETFLLVTGNQFEVELIAEISSIPVNKVPGLKTSEPLQTNLLMCTSKE